MESDQNRTNLTIIIVLLIVIVGISIFYIINHFFTKTELNSNYNDDEIVDSGDTSVIDDTDSNYGNYNIGDSITLIDSSKWHVIENSSSSDSYITILKDTRIDNSLKYSEVDNYLDTEYKKLLKDSLSLTEDDIFQIRLLSISDIREITNIDNLESGTVIENNNYSWLYNDMTLIDSSSDNSNPLLICQKDSSNSARICEGNNSDLWAVRPVIAIKKDFIK